MMKITIFVSLFILSMTGCSHADAVKGAIEKVDIREYRIMVKGSKVNVSKATIFTENDMGVTKNVLVRDLKDHRGETAVCYGSIDNEGTLVAYKVRIMEGHK